MPIIIPTTFRAAPGPELALHFPVRPVDAARCPPDETMLPADARPEFRLEFRYAKKEFRLEFS